MGATTTDEDEALDERDARILQSTEELISELGYDRVRLIDIADRAGVSVGSLQHRYRTREGLLRATVEQVASSEVADVMGMTVTIEDAYERLIALLERTLVMFDPTGPASLLWLELVVVSARNEELKEILTTANANWHLAFEQTIQEGFEKGRFSSDLDCTELGTVLVALIDGFAVHRILGDGRPEPAELVATARAVIDGLIKPC